MPQDASNKPPENEIPDFSNFPETGSTTPQSTVGTNQPSSPIKKSLTKKQIIIVSIGAVMVLALGLWLLSDMLKTRVKYEPKPGEVIPKLSPKKQQ